MTVNRSVLATVYHSVTNSGVAMVSVTEIHSDVATGCHSVPVTVYHSVTDSGAVGAGVVLD